MTNNKISRGLKRAQSRLLNQNSRKILNNVFLMYIVLFASIADLLYLVSIGEHTNVIVFAVAAYITSIFSKNMSVVLIVALAITNICHLGKGIIVKEGFKESEEDPEDTEDADDTEDVESSGSSDKEVSDKEVSDKEVSDKEVSDKEVSEKKNGKVSEDDSDSNEKKIKTKKIGKLPEEYKQTLAQLSDPETLKTIEGLKSLKPLLGKMERVIGMFV
jgi:hypothetical protein